MSWTNGYLSFGRGLKHGEDILMSMYDFDPFPVRAIAIETKDVAGVIRVAYPG